MYQALSFLVLLMCLSNSTLGDELWRQAGDGQSSHGPCWRWSAVNADKLLADDFDVTGEVRQVRVGGGTYSVNALVLEGVHVRFFEYRPDNTPGALQAEYFVPVGGNLEYEAIDVTGTLWFVATIDPPFHATGRHFVSVQPQMDREWFWASSATGAPRGQAFYFRSSATQPWQHGDQQPFNDDNCDLNVTLYGTLTGAPRIDILGAGTLPRSGRLTIHGANFANAQGTGHVLIDGIRAPNTTWTDDRIVAYIPEQTALGAADVQVVTAAGASAAASLNVTLRQSEGRVSWRFEADGDDLWWRPALAPDGTLYVHGSQGFVYALQSDGGLKWTASANWFPYVPPAAGLDGAAYCASIQTVFAFNPDGSERWRFTDADAQGASVGIGIGPDGNQYLANDFGLGAYSLSPDGTLRWSNPGDPILFQHGGTGAEMTFGPRTPGGPVDQMYVAMDRGNSGDARLYGFSLDGTQRFATYAGQQDSPFMQQQTQPAVGPDGTIYLTHFRGGAVGWSLEAYSPETGQPQWYYETGGDLAPPEVGPDGIVYLTTIGSIRAFDPAQRVVRWTFDDDTVLDWPTVSPNNDMLVFGGVVDVGSVGFIKAVSTTGELLWTVDLPGAPWPGRRVLPVHRPRFTPDGQTVYVSTVTLSGGSADPHCYLYAIRTGDVTRPGDVDGDGDVDLADLALLLSAFGTCAGDAGFDAAADFDASGCVELGDLAMLLSSFGS